MTYTDHHIAENQWIRIFSEDANPTDLLWHRDEKPRKIIVLNNTDWSFQFDNQIPIRLKKDQSITIPQGVWHRVIKGTGTLKLLISE